MDFPKRYAQYSLLKRIATGVYTDTFLARRYRDEGTGREFVVKRLQPELAKSGETIDIFRQSARRAALLDHPHIARVFEFNQVSSAKCHLCQEYIWGEDLWRIAERGMTAGRFLPIHLAVKVVSDVASALVYCHDQIEPDHGKPGLLCGDLSPANVMVGYDGGVKILDFGIPVETLQQWDGIRRGPLEAKLAYISPEQAAGTPIDTRSDLFALGALLYEFTTRKRLFKGTETSQIVKLVLQAEIPHPSEDQPNYPPGLERIVLKALARDPEERYQNAAEMRQELEELLQSGLEEATREQLASYLLGIFPDKIADVAGLLGENYQGPKAEEVKALPWAPFLPLREERTTPSHVVKSVKPAALPGPVFPALTPAVPSIPRSESTPAGLDLGLFTPKPPPSPPPVPQQPPKPSVKSVLHTLRKDHPDEFEKTAQRSSQVAWILGILVAGVAVAIFAYYLLFYQWPWQALMGGRVVEPGPIEVLAPRQMPSTIPVPLASTPPGAAVAINGIMAPQPTPAIYPLVPYSTNTVGLFLDGYATAFLNLDLSGTAPGEGVTLALTELPPIEVSLTPPPPAVAEGTQPPTWPTPRGRLNVTTRPAGANILLNGRLVCEQAPCEFEVQAGQEQHIAAQLPDYLETVAFTVAPPWEHHLDTKYLQLELSPVSHGARLYTYLEITSVPRGARVYVNGERIGRTPLNIARPINELIQVEMQADGYESWQRTFYPSPGHIQLSPLLQPLPRPQAQLTLVVDAPDMPGTRIYLGPNEMGTDAIEAVTVEAGTQTLTLSYTPPADAPDPNRRRSRMDLDLPAATHVTVHYRWNRVAFELVERTEQPADFPASAP